ncbi:MAG: exodeoxyribonuclease VII small subunit [Gammaproteobacteria bacterium]|nr:MAG: exodeoxyribonuclease VII small subunit [Gammaproteobacteria bacterium]
MTDTPDFETALKQLEAIVQTLEQGELGLEDAMARYEEGVRLSRQCQQALREAELRISQLSNEADGPADSHPPGTDTIRDDRADDGLDDDLPF